MYKIKKAGEHHILQIAKLAHLLWPSEDLAIIKKQMYHFHRDSTAELFVCEANDVIVAFAHVQLRFDYVEGTVSSPVGYLEGIYVDRLFRKKGIGRQLVEVCEDWARFMKAKEFASDVELSNEMSMKFHEAVKFKEVSRIICYTKAL